MENGAFTGINDFVISFEPLCYFTKLVERVMKLFISWAWIDHIAWGHGNTLVRGILVSAYSLTFSRPKLDQINQKLTNNAKECVFLCLWMCRNGYLRKGQKITRKWQNEHEIWKSVNSRSRGSLVVKVKAHMVIRSPQSFRNYKNGPWS